MTSQTTRTLETQLIEHLHALSRPEHPDRGALAALRRSLSRVPGSEFEAYRHLSLLARVNERDEPWFRLIAGLFAMHPQQATEPGTSLGAAFRLAVRNDDERDAVERRFVVLLKAHREDLSTHLRSAVGFLGSRDIPIDYAQLLSDVRWWETPDNRVQRRWARHFWGARPDTDEKQPPHDDGGASSGADNDE